MKDIFDIDHVKKLTSEGRDEEAFNYCLGFAEQCDAEAQSHVGYYYFKGLGVPKDNVKAAEWHKKAAELGNSNAMFNLALCYYNGDGVPQNAETAIEWYKKAAELGNSNAMYNLALCYYNGDGVQKSAETAVEWYKKAAELGDSTAMNNLANYYYNGDGVPQNAETAVEWYKKAAELGNSTAMNNLAVCYINGKGVPQNAGTAVEWFKRAAELGDSTAMYNLAFRYGNGVGVPENAETALEWYTKAAESGSSKAMVELADYYIEGSCVNKDIDKAVKLYMKAADLENGSAMNKLATFYEKGIGVSKSLNKAAYWYKKSAETGDNSAMFHYGILHLDSGGIQDDYLRSALSDKEYFNYNVSFSLFAVATCLTTGTGVDFDPFRAEVLYKRAVDHFKEGSDKKISLASFALGICFEIGKGVPSNMRKAVKYYKKSVYNDNAPCPNSQYKLASLYFDGKGVRKNYHKAVQLFLKAAEQGYPEAQYRVAECYADGIGTSRNTDKASYWYIRAAANGHDMALYKAGEFFEYGIGTDADNITAIAYYRRAVAKGVKEAENHLRELERVSSLNGELEERISKLTYQLKEKECELAAEREKQKNDIQMAVLQQQFLEIKQTMMSGFDDLRAVSDETNRVVKDTNSRVGEIQSQLSSLSDYLVKDLPSVLKEKRRESGCDSLTTNNIDELSVNDEKKIGNFCSAVRRIIENQIREKTDLIRNSREELEKRMGGIWSEFSPDTRNSLASAMTLLKAYRNVTDECFDFSGIGILATSALENELRRVLFIDFQKFALKQAGGVISALPKQLRYYDAKDKQWILSDPEHFALGQIPYIFGQKGIKGNDQKDIELLNNYRESYLEAIVDRDIKTRKNLSSFSEYFTKAVFSEGSDVPEKDWMCYYPGSLISEFEAVRKTRNQSAHAGGLGRDDAEKCCAKIIGSDLVDESQNKFDHVVGLLEKLYILLGKRK